MIKSIIAFYVTNDVLNQKPFLIYIKLYFNEITFHGNKILLHFENVCFVKFFKNSAYKKHIGVRDGGHCALCPSPPCAHPPPKKNVNVKTFFRGEIGQIKKKS